MGNFTVLRTPRLIVDEVSAADIPLVFDVRQSNPDRLLRTEGSGGEPGKYDRDMLERDVQVAQLDPARLLLACRPAQPDAAGTQLVGILDLLTEHPEDGHPWLGTVEIHRTVQRRGYGREAATAAIEYLSPAGSGRVIRCTVDNDDSIGRAFAASCGFAPTTRMDGCLWEWHP